MSIPKPLANIGREFSKVLMSFYLYHQYITSLSPLHGRNTEDAAHSSVRKFEVCPIKCIYEPAFLESWLGPSASLIVICMLFNLSGVTAQLSFPWTWLPSFCSESNGEIGKAMRVCRTFKWSRSPQCALSRPLSLSLTPLLHFLLSLLPLSFLHPPGQASCQQYLINS